jgi:hypothetical protein
MDNQKNPTDHGSLSEYEEWVPVFLPGCEHRKIADYDQIIYVLRSYFREVLQVEFILIHPSMNVMVKRKDGGKILFDGKDKIPFVDFLAWAFAQPRIDEIGE